MLPTAFDVALPAGLAYDPSEDRAHTLHGRPVPSVTQINKAMGLSSDFSQVRPDVLERKRTIGQAVHAASHYFDEGDLVVRSVAPGVQPYLDAWRRFRDERRFQPVLLETIVASTTHHYIGRFDRLGIVDDRQDQWVRILADLKIGDPDDAGAQWQTAGYEVALRECCPDLAPYTLLRWSIQLRPDGTYRLDQYPKKGRTNRQDRNEFLAAACMVHVRTAQQGGVPCWR